MPTKMAANENRTQVYDQRRTFDWPRENP